MYLYYTIVRKSYIQQILISRYKIIINFFCRKYEIKLTKIQIHSKVIWRYKESSYQFQSSDIVDPEKVEGF